MIKNPRRKVLRWEMKRPFPTWNETAHAILECGHEINVGHSDYRPKRMACMECGKSASKNTL